MVLYNSLLIAFAAASLACYSYYLKEKKLLRQFMRHSRRHTENKDIDITIQQKATRYLTFCVLLFCITIPFIIQNFIKGFIEQNWQWLISFLSIPIIILAYKSISANRKNRTTKGFSLSYNRNASEQ